MESEKFRMVAEFAPGEADRTIAGVAAAARVVRELAESGTERIVLAVPGGSLAPATLKDIRRLSPAAIVEIVDQQTPAAVGTPRSTTREVLRTTAKASDGLVSRWLNRPVSRGISALLLLIPGIRPLHATIGTAVLAGAMFVALVIGGAEGLIAGGCLFQAASIFDGVDGEIARATFRTSRLGALLDSVVDMITNVLFVTGVIINLSASDELAAAMGAWGLLLFVIGLVVISRSAAREERPFSMDLVKRRSHARFPGLFLPRLIRIFTIVSSRDFFALLFALLILAGLPMAVLYIFAAAATVWIAFVVGACSGGGVQEPKVGLE